MANYTWFGKLCGPAGGVTISKGEFGGHVGSLIDGNNLYSGKIFRDSAVATPITCDFPGNTYMTSSELKDGTYDRYNYSREHDFNILCIPGVEVRINTEQDQEYVYNGTGGTLGGVVFSQVIEAIPAAPLDFSFSYTTGCDETDLDYIEEEIDITAAGAIVQSSVSLGWVLDKLQTYVDISNPTWANEAPTSSDLGVPIGIELKDNFFLTYELKYTNSVYLSLYEYDFSNDSIALRHHLYIGNLRHMPGDNDNPVSNGYVVFDDINDRVFVGEQMYTGSKPNQGLVEVFAIDFTLKTITLTDTLHHPSPGRYSYFGCSVAVDCGPNGSGQVIVGSSGDECFYFFDGTTLAEIPANLMEGGRDSLYGNIVAAYNGILVYVDAEVYQDLYTHVMQKTWSGSAWGSAVPMATGWYSNGVSTLKTFSTSRFTDPSGSLTKRPFLFFSIRGTYAYAGPDGATRYLTAGNTTYGNYGISDGPGGYSYGVAGETEFVKRYDSGTGLPWNNLGSYTNDIDTNGDVSGWYRQFPLVVANPSDANDQRLLKLIYGQASGYHYFVDILDIGWGDVFQVPIGNFYIKHTLDVSLWAAINTGSTVSIQNDDDKVRWVFSTDNGTTWYSIQSAGGDVVQMSSFADGYTNAGLVATFNSDASKIPVLGASDIIFAFLLVSGSVNQQTSPTITSMAINYGLILGDPEFVLNHSTSGFNSKIESMSNSAQNWIYVTVEAPTTVDHCTLVLSQKTTDYTSLYGT